MNNGFVYTLRTRYRTTGRTVAMWHALPLCFVVVQRVVVKVPGDLDWYVSRSGFDSVDEWLKAASINARTLYLVTEVQ